MIDSRSLKWIGRHSHHGSITYTAVTALAVEQRKETTAKWKGMELDSIIESMDKDSGIAKRQTSGDCTMSGRSMWTTLNITPKTLTDAKPQEENTQRTRKWLAHADKLTIHAVRTCSTCSALRRMIQVCILCATMHRNPDLCVFPMSASLQCHCLCPLTRYSNKPQFHSLSFVRLSVFHLFRRRCRDCCILCVIGPWGLCLPIHFNDLLSIVHLGWVCMHCQTLFGSNYSDCVPYSKVRWVK